jgi:predicted amidophosphoribosyltransferase
MRSLNPVYCPKCKLGFSPATVLCPSCGIELVADEELDVADETADPETDVSDLDLLRTADVAWVRNLVEKLAEAEIPFRLLPDKAGAGVSVCVRGEDFEMARRIDHEVYKSEVHGTEAVRASQDLDFGSCPACGASLGALDKECRSCGLMMSGRGWRCANCQGELEGEEEVCPHCEEEVNWDKV